MARWPPGFTMLPVPLEGVDAQQGAVYGLSADGKTAVGWVFPHSVSIDVDRQACFWTPTSGPTLIAPVGTSALDVSQDGAVIVGGRDVGDPGTGTPFYWTAAGGAVPFGVTTDAVFAISADASRIVGQTQIAGIQQPCYWNSGALTTVPLSLPGGFSGGAANDVSEDGSVIVGDLYPTVPGPAHPFRWTAATGTVDLGYPAGITPPVNTSQALGVSDDGNTIVGFFQHTVGGSSSFIWTPTSYVDIPDTNIYGFDAISGDGSTVYGAGWYPDISHDAGNHMAYMMNGHVVVPTPTLFPGAEISASYSAATNGISRDGLVMGGFAFGGGIATRPFIYVAPQLAMDNVMIGSSECMLCLDWSDDRGHTFGVPVCQSMDTSGYLTSLQWQRLGMARDRVFRLTWGVIPPSAITGLSTSRTASGFHVLPLTAGAHNGEAYAISADRHTAAGYVTSPSDDTVSLACYWTSATGNWADAVGPVIISDPLVDEGASNANDTSSDGSVIVGAVLSSPGGSSSGPHPFRWTSAGGMVAIDTLFGEARAISGDGSRIVGRRRYSTGPDLYQACYWDATSLVRTDLGFLSGHVESIAQAISADGSIIVGTSSGGSPARAFRWTAAGGMVDLGVAGGATSSTGLGVSSDGTVATGVLNYDFPYPPGDSQGDIFRWTAAGGMVALPSDTVAVSLQHGSSSDGSVIAVQTILPTAGTIPSWFGSSLSYWTAAGGVITPAPIELDPINFPSVFQVTNAYSISADGNAIAGSGAQDDPLSPYYIPFVYMLSSPTPPPPSDGGCRAVLQGAWYTAIAERRRGKK